jgi:ankyrin repeat protein
MNLDPSSRAKGGHYAAAGLLLDRGAEIDAKDTQGRTPLHLAAEACFPPLVQLLLDRGADVHARDERKRTPLHYAARGQSKYMHHEGHWRAPRRSSVPIARSLIAAGAEVIAADNRGQTPLHLAARAGNVALTEHLLAKCADVNALARDDSGRECLTPLVEATLGGMEIPPGQPGGHVEVALLLVHAGAKANVADRDRRMAPLYWAAAKKHLTLAAALIENGADVNAKVESWYRNTPLLRAAENGHSEMLRLLLDAGADNGAVSTDGYTAVGLAAGNGHLAALKLLVSAGADVTGALARAATENQLEAASFLLDHGADPNEKSSLDRAPLHHLAIAGGSPQLAELLIAKGADLQADALEGGRRGNVRGATPLKLALLNGHGVLAQTFARNGATLDVFARAGLGRVEELRQSLDEGTPPDQPDALGRRPLHFAVANDQAPAASLLLERGAGVNARDAFDATPLHLAVRLGNTKMVEWLLARKADPNARNATGETPLHGACSPEAIHQKIYEILLKHGADPKIRDRDGRQALPWRFAD